MSIWTGMSRTELEAGIADLRSSIASGARVVHFRTGDGERKVEFRSLAEMQSTLAGMLAELNTLIQSSQTMVRQIRTYSNKGL
jgi:hypothetical protein